MIHVKNLSGGYIKHKPIIDHVTFQVNKGEFFAFIGPNGSGKTTLFKLITGVLPLEKGEIHLLSRPLSDYSPFEKAKIMAVLSQHEQVEFDFSVEEIVLLGRYPHQKGFFKMVSKEDLQIVEQAMKVTNIYQYKHKPFNNLSGGEKQRVLLAKALAQKPSIILLDEPTNHLDIKHTFEMLTLLKEWQKNHQLTILAILHDLNVASLFADRIGLLNKGKLVDVGTQTILEKEGLLEGIYDVNVKSQAHPTIPRPQTFLTPKEEEKEETVPFFDRYQIKQNHDLIHICFDRPLRTLSNGVIGEGIQWVYHFCNFHVALDYNSSNPKQDVKKWMKQYDIPHEQAIGMMTAVHLDDLAVIEKKVDEFSFLIVVTAGVSNAVDISYNQAIQSKQSHKVGTINIMVFIDGNLTDGALVNAIQSCTEAKAKALFDLNIKDPITNTIATGTSTDSLLIATTQKGKKTPYAGSGTKLGKGLGNVVYQATTTALKKYQKRISNEK